MIMRARNDALLYLAFAQGRAANMTDAEILEALVHYLLDLKDEVYQQKLSAVLQSAVSPMVVSRARNG